MGELRGWTCISARHEYLYHTQIPKPNEAFLPSFLPSFLTSCDRLNRIGRIRQLMGALALGLAMVSMQPTYGQIRIVIVTDCKCQYIVNIIAPDGFTYGLPVSWESNLDINWPYDPQAGQIAIKKPGYGVVFGPAAFPALNGMVLDEDCAPVPLCDCVVDGINYTPNFQFGFDAPNRTWYGKLTCKQHP